MFQKSRVNVFRIYMLFNLLYADRLFTISACIYLYLAEKLSCFYLALKFSSNPKTIVFLDPISKYYEGRKGMYLVKT